MKDFEFKNFLTLVKRMRENQIMFFKTKEQYYLTESKVLEKQVDSLIKQLESPTLFE